MLYTAIERMTGSGFYPFSAAARKLIYIGIWRGYFLEMDALDREEHFNLKLFIDLRGRSATNLRDKIYSRRGIVNNALAAGITVDYDKSVERESTRL